MENDENFLPAVYWVIGLVFGIGFTVILVQFPLEMVIYAIFKYSVING